LDVNGNEISSPAFKERLDMLIRDARVYGQILAKQRRLDLIGADPGFLARHRSDG